MDQGQDSYFIPSSYSRIVARELGLMERDLPRLLRGTGLPVDILLPGDETRLSGRQQLRILDNGRRMLDTPEFGLRLGQRLGPSAHGPLGYLALSSPDLITALESLRDYLPVRVSLVELEVALEAAWLNCTLRIRVQANPDEAAYAAARAAGDPLVYEYFDMGVPETSGNVAYGTTSIKPGKISPRSRPLWPPSTPT